jgi:cation-transporting ATPase 13A1
LEMALDGRSRALFAVTIVFLGLSFIAVVLRCFVQLRLVKAFG